MIDETTGMPELPEGMAWRVSEEQFDSGSTLRVTLMLKKVQEVETVRDEYWRDEPKEHWYSRPKRELVVETVVETVEGWVATEYSDNLRHPISVRDESDLPAGYTVLLRDAWGISAVRYDDPTPENIRAVALKVWAEYEESQAEKAEARRQAEIRKALVGMYPPMKLGGK